MGPWVKRFAAAYAIKEGIERIQEARRPKRSRRFLRLLTLVGIGGGIAYLYKTGKLEPMIEQAKDIVGGEETGVEGDFGQAEWTAPAATTGATPSGATSTSTSV